MLAKSMLGGWFIPLAEETYPRPIWLTIKANRLSWVVFSGWTGLKFLR